MYFNYTTQGNITAKEDQIKSSFLRSYYSGQKRSCKIKLLFEDNRGVLLLGNLALLLVVLPAIHLALLPTVADCVTSSTPLDILLTQANCTPTHRHVALGTGHCCQVHQGSVSASLAASGMPAGFCQSLSC